MTTYQTGSDVDSYCSKCKLTLTHIIIAMKDTKIARAQCKTCKAVHAFRAAPSTETAVTRKARTTVKKPSRASSSKDNKEKLTNHHYETMLGSKDISHAHKYISATGYIEGDVLNHALFGIGFVTKVLADNKVEVLFPNSLKVLVHARS